jgi:hypothetical protein
MLKNFFRYKDHLHLNAGMGMVRATKCIDAQSVPTLFEVKWLPDHLLPWP